ncbi:MAG: D-glycero-beta-D-manno-heptose 1-phosphate adenylyltransferase [Deltaproteobacteria bacterium]|nr:D-glycero-beta-D-manno-heptose 1-phosphate adenylyltransferase [Deltaproteobacteria bacterium]
MTWEQALNTVQNWRRQRLTVVFTNGCFDLMHIGHLRYLSEARALGQALVVGLNSDRSIREIKGPSRPIMPQDQRGEILAGLEMIDAVVTFDQPTPLELITWLKPDILVKGGDWPIDRIVGREVVQAQGGRILTIPLTPGVSTTAIIHRVLELYHVEKEKE